MSTQTRIIEKAKDAVKFELAELIEISCGLQGVGWSLSESGTINDSGEGLAVVAMGKGAQKMVNEVTYAMENLIALACKNQPENTEQTIDKTKVKKENPKQPLPTNTTKKEIIDKELHSINDNLIELIEAQDGIRSIGMGMKTDMGDVSPEGFVVTSMATLIQKLTNDIGKRLDAVGEEIEEFNGMKFNW